MPAPRHAPHPADRRKDRASEALGALTRLLEAARVRSGLEAVAVAETAGILVAGAGPAHLCDELAAWAPLSAGAANDCVPCRLDVIERRGVVRRVAVDGVEIIVCGVGGDDAAAGELRSVARGCERILGDARTAVPDPRG